MILKLWSTLGFTAILVTHDIEEAVYLADRVLVMEEGGRGIAASVPVKLPRPRNQVDTRELPLYLEYRRELLSRVLAPAQEAA
jgi:ABC-type nitrate/sulfonate/bicarbonate transport system ATPase subunit